VEFSIRDDRSARAILRSQSGQGLTEYILILIVVVGLILGGIYQFNGAFKAWANNYFGDYLSCLLETGELPTISGTGGDSGLCNQFFKPFTLADGRPLIPGQNEHTPSQSGGDGGGTREKPLPRAGSAYSSGSRGAGRFGGQFGRGASGGGARSKLKGSSFDSSSENGVGTMNYGQTYSAKGSQGQGKRLRYRLDTQFAYGEDKEPKQRRKAASVVRKPDAGGRSPRILLRKKELKKAQQVAVDESMTFAGFLRFLIIAAIIIALVMFLGGQALQIGKSMER